MKGIFDMMQNAVSEPQGYSVGDMLFLDTPQNWQCHVFKTQMWLNTK